MSGSSRKTQPMAAASDGTNIETRGRTSASHPTRASVRSFSHASTAPTVIAKTPPAATRIAVLRNALSVSALVTTCHGVEPSLAVSVKRPSSACTSG